LEASTIIILFVANVEIFKKKIVFFFSKDQKICEGKIGNLFGDILFHQQW
jgi:hypothetical protein